MQETIKANIKEGLSIFSSQAFYENLALTFVLFVLLLLIRTLVIGSLSNSKIIPKKDRRQWIVTVKTIFLLIFMLALLNIWAKELETFAVSLVAVAVAFVLAFKEIIMNISGYFTRLTTKPYSIGDRVEIRGLRGDVIDQNLFVTRLLEIGPQKDTHEYTGRSVTFPNSLILTDNIVNESFTSRFCLHTFSVPILIDGQLMEHVEALRDAANEACNVHIPEAQRVFDQFSKKQAIDPPDVHPRVHIRFLDRDTVNLVVRIPVAFDDKGTIEQAVIAKFCEYYIPKRPQIMKNHNAVAPN